MSLIGKPTYGIIDRGAFGIKVVSGIITNTKTTDGIVYYEITLDKKNSYWTSKVTDRQENLGKMLDLPKLKSRIELPLLEIINRKIKYLVFRYL